MGGIAGGGGGGSSAAGTVVIAGSIDCSTNPNYPAATAGQAYIVSVAGKIGGASGPTVGVGDTLICTTTAIAGTHAAVGSSWVIVQANLVETDYLAIAPATAARNRIQPSANVVPLTTRQSAGGGANLLECQGEDGSVRGSIDQYGMVNATYGYAVNGIRVIDEGFTFALRSGSADYNATAASQLKFSDNGNDSYSGLTFDVGLGRDSAGIAKITDGGDALYGSLKLSRLESTVTTGTAPFTVASTTLVTNLNAEQLGGKNLGTIETDYGNAINTAISTLVASLAAGTTPVAWTGITGAPTIPTATSQLSNDSGFVAGSGYNGTSTVGTGTVTATNGIVTGMT